MELQAGFGNILDEKQQKSFSDLIMGVMEDIYRQYVNATYDVHSSYDRIVHEHNDTFFQKIDNPGHKQEYNPKQQEIIQRINKNKQIQRQLQKFISIMMNLPGILMQMLEKQQLQTKQAFIDFYNYIDNEIYGKIHQTLLQEKSILTIKIFQHNRELKQKLLKLLKVVSQRFARQFKNGCQKMHKSNLKFEEFIKETQLINPIILYAILRQYSRELKQQLRIAITHGCFKQASTQQVQQMIRFIIQKKDIIKLYAGQENKLIATYYFDQLQLGKKATIRLAYEPSTQNHGIFISVTTLPDRQNEGFISYINQNNNLTTINSKITRRNWQVSSVPIKNQIINQVIPLLSKKKNFFNYNQAEFVPLDYCAIVDNNFGKSLIRVEQFHTIRSFMKDLSLRTVMVQSFNTIMSTAPIIGIFIIGGVLSYKCYHILKSKSVSNKKKMQEMSGFALKSGTTVGSSITGGIIGQFLIPVPVVGALLGSVVGGLIGQRVGSKINQTIDQDRLKEQVLFIEKTMQQEGYWKVNEPLIAILRLNSQNFKKSTPKTLQPKNLSKQQAWITMICFTILSFDYNQKLQKFNEKKLSQIQYKEKKQGKTAPSTLENKYLQSDTDQYHYQISIEKPIIRLEQENINLQNYIRELQKIMLPLLKLK